MAQAVRRTRSMRVDLTVDGSVVAGLPHDVLVEFSQLADLLVIGDHAGSGRGHSPAGRRVENAAGCPVVRVPAGGARFDAPVAVVLDERGIEAARSDSPSSGRTGMT